MNEYIAAESKNLFIGTYALDAIRICESGEFRIAQKQSLELIEVDRFWLQNMVKALQREGSALTQKQQDYNEAWKVLQSMGFTMFLKSVKYSRHDKRGRNIVITSESLSLPDVRILWRYFDKQGNKKASDFIDALSEDSLRDRFRQIFHQERDSQEERRRQDNRVMDNPRALLELLYGNDICKKLNKLYKNHFQVARFFWTYCYGFLTPEERAKHEQMNPLVNKRRGWRIYQFLDEATIERLHPHVKTLYILIMAAHSKQQLESMLNEAFQEHNQMDLFDLWDFDEAA